MLLEKNIYSECSTVWEVCLDTEDIVVTYLHTPAIWIIQV